MSPLRVAWQRIALLFRSFSMRLSVIAVLIGLGTGAVLNWWDGWRSVEVRAYDVLNVATAPLKSTLPITIIAIDEASFAQTGQRWPWPRSMHAKLVDRLAASQASVIAFDLLFPEASTPEDDEAFAKAIERAGNVVLAADHAYHETSAARQWIRVDPIQTLTMAGAVTGLATSSLDDDAIMRRVPQPDDALWRQAIRMLIRTRPGSVEEPWVHPDAMVRHLGPARTFPYVSYYQVLNGDESIPPDFFQDQIVLIGRDVRASLDSGLAQAEAFGTSFLRSSRQMTPGVEVHATLIENALMGLTVTPSPPWQLWSLLAGAMLLAWPFVQWWHPLRSAIGIVGIGGAAVGLSAWLYVSFSTWLPMLSTLVALGLTYGTTAAGSYLTERRRATEIRGALEKYVSGDIVAEIVAHPERLQLGGQRKELTVFFCDLAGFTTLSENLTPEALASVINVYLSEVTHIILAHGGTVDKFIGDAVMAFWGAPLDDPEHAFHGVTSAIEVLVAMQRLQPKFDSMGAPGLGLRIGLHSGPAIVGNMGSDLRFNYTAVGDTVNLAARLEGANKAYGTGTLFTAATVEGLKGRIPVRRVDRVKVKGKHQAVDVFTACADLELVALSDAAWAAWEARDWAAARAVWQDIVSRYPSDTVAPGFIARLDAMLAEGEPTTWDASIALEKL